MFYFNKFADINYVGYNHAQQLNKKAIKWAGLTLLENPVHNAIQIIQDLPVNWNPKKVKRCKFLLFYTMYEATCVPRSWIKRINQTDGLVVPSQTQKDLFIVNGAKVPVFVAEHYVDPGEHSLTPYIDDGVYTFLWAGRAITEREGERKGNWDIRQLFKKLNLPNSRLILKTSRNQNQGTLDIPRKEFWHQKSNLKMWFLCNNHTNEEINDLYKVVDCCVNPSHGEGFGMIPQEQMARGRPVILTRWSFPFCNDAYNLPLDYELKPSICRAHHKHLWITPYHIHWTFGIKPHYKKFRNPKELFPDKPWKQWTVFQEFAGYDASINTNDLMDKMKWCYENQDAARRMGQKAAVWINKEYNISKTAQRWKDIYNYYKGNL